MEQSNKRHATAKAVAAHDYTLNGAIVEQTDTKPLIETPLGADFGGGLALTKPVHHIQGLLGPHAVLLPVKRGEKVPSISGWQNTTVEMMDDLNYLGTLDSGNIGVLLGQPSEGLCTIDIDDDSFVESFLALNPGLRSSLRSKGARGVQIWVQCTDEVYPSLTSITTNTGDKWGEWRSTGGQSVIHGVHPSGVPYRFIHEAKPVEISFADIQWPEDLKTTWKDRATQEAEENWGEPFDVSENGGVLVNHSFWVNKYMVEHRVVFDTSICDIFEYEVATGLWKKQTEESIKRTMLTDLQKVAKHENLPKMHFKITEGLGVGFAGLLRTLSAKHDVFSDRPQAIHVKNGMICFQAGKPVLKTFHPDYLSRNACPFAYDKDADCPRFKRELLGMALDDDDIKLMQKWSGACLLGNNEAQRFLMVMGTPGGGKSTFMNCIEGVIGTHNVGQLRTEHLGNRFELFSFLGKTLLSGKDVSSDFLLNKSAYVIKALVGEDMLTAEKKGYSEPIQIKGAFNIGMTCNADLNIRLEGDIGAWKRRMMVVRYDRPPVERRIPGLVNELLEQEGSGILNWMVEGAVKYLADLKAHGNYRLTPNQDKRVDDLLAQSDSVKCFVEKLVRKSQGFSLTVGEFKKGYFAFCEASGWVPLPASEVSEQMLKAMLALGCRLRHDIGMNKTQRGYEGVRLLEEVPDCD